MPFDFNALMSDPGFIGGMGLLGAGSGRPNAMEAYKVLQGQRAFQQKQTMDQATLGLERQKTDLYGQQVQGQNTQNQINALKLMKQLQLQDQMLKFLPTLQQSISTRFAKPDPTTGQPTLGTPPVPGSPQGFDPSKPTVQTPNGPVQAPEPPKGFYRSIIPSLEGGTNPDGSFRTSPKGAIGPAQVMPNTAPEAAALAGLPFDETKYRTDPEYNLTLGEAYFNKQLQDFGTFPHALAAYNAGPSAVQNAMNQAKKMGNPSMWLAFMPDPATRAYVQKGTAAYMQQQGAQQPTPYTGGPVPPSMTAQGLIQAERMQQEQHKQLMANFGMMQYLSGDFAGGLKAIGDATGADYEGLKMMLQQHQNDIQNLQGQQRIGMEAGNLAVNQGRLAMEQANQPGIQAERAATTARTLQETQAAQQKLKSDKTDIYAAVRGTVNSLDLLTGKIAEVLQHPGLAGNFGPRGMLPNPPGGPAADAAAQLQSVGKQVGLDALTALKKSGATLGQVSNYEDEMLQQAIRNLAKTQSYESARNNLSEIMKWAQKAKNVQLEAYEMKYGESPIKGPDGKAAPIGTRMVGTSGGKAAYRAPGMDKMFTQEE